MQGEQIPEEQLRLWLAQALLALLALQQAAVVHRDLKTANLFLSDEGNLLVGDFGLAARRRGDAGAEAC